MAGFLAGQFRPEQQHQSGKAERAGHHHARRDARAEPKARVQRIPQGRRRKHHRHQAARYPLRRGVEAQEIQAEQAQPLAHAQPMPAPVQPLQLAGQQQGREQDDARQREAVEDRHRNGDHAQLELDGDPGGAPDDDSEEIQEEVHSAARGKAETGTRESAAGGRPGHQCAPAGAWAIAVSCGFCKLARAARARSQ
ncbi:hypothetical protein D9M68_684960 [compost metagenome]